MLSKNNLKKFKLISFLIILSILFPFWLIFISPFEILWRNRGEWLDNIKYMIHENKRMWVLIFTKTDIGMYDFYQD